MSVPSVSALGYNSYTETVVLYYRAILCSIKDWLLARGMVYAWKDMLVKQAQYISNHVMKVRTDTV